VREETGDEILSCWYFGDDKVKKPIYYDMFYGDQASDMKKVGRIIMEKLKRRNELLMMGSTQSCGHTNFVLG
jgi:hypothetical protein